MMSKLISKSMMFLCGGLLAPSVFASSITVPMFLTSDQGVGASVGQVVVTQTPYGLMFTPRLHGLTPGEHGFHLHQNASCDNGGMAAGGHFDPENTGKHRGPFDDSGHLGDLPVLVVNEDGTVTKPVMAPRLHQLSDVQNHSLMVHANGDNYDDTPEKLGGGGARMVCGVIKAE